MQNKSTGLFACKSDDKGNLVPNNPEDWKAYMYENPDTEFMVEITPKDKLTEKQRLFNFYGGVILPLTVKVLRQDGWDVGRVEADGFLNAQCGKDTIVSKDGNSMEVIVTSKRDDSLAKLTQRINDSVMLLWHQFQVVVPDSEEYLNEINKTTIRSAKKALYKNKF